MKKLLIISFLFAISDLMAPPVRNEQKECIECVVSSASAVTVCTSMLIAICACPEQVISMQNVGTPSNSNNDFNVNPTMIKKMQ